MTDVPEEVSEELERIGNKLAAKRKIAPKVNYEKNGDDGYKIRIGAKSSMEDAARLMEALGVFDTNMLDGFLSQVSNSVATNKGRVNQTNTDFALGFVKSIEPQNEVEAALAAQMAATHVCMMDSSRRLLMAESLLSRESAERAMNRLGRTFAAQMDALKRYRQTAQQTVRVERVTVNEGGQAIVGGVSVEGRADAKN